VHILSHDNPPHKVTPIRIKCQVESDLLMKFNFSPTIFYLIFIIPAICDAHHYKIGDQSDDILFFNVGQKHKNKNFAVSLSHEYRFGLPELAVTGLNLEYRMRNVQSSLGLYSSGDDIYRENRILLTSSRVLSMSTTELVMTK
jgi:hypothetical protein